MFLCVCKGIRLSDGVAAAKSGFDSPDSIKRVFGLEGEDCCGRCARHIDSFVARVRLELVREEVKQGMAAVPAGR
jgi:bacterioferritin-associated ferredoxin